MLHFGVISHGAGQGDRGLLLDVLDGPVKGPSGNGIVDVGKGGFGPGKDAQHEQVDAGGASGYDAADIAVGNKDALEDGIIATRGPHAHGVPCFLME